MTSPVKLPQAAYKKAESTKLDVKAIATDYALEMGFDLVRVTSAEEFAQDRAVTLKRLQAGLMDGLPWFNEPRVRRGANPSALLTSARSIICLGRSYYQPSETHDLNRHPIGKVALYAWGRDYHKVMKKMMGSYVQGLRYRLGDEFLARWYVDDGPMLDRAAANRSGLGWFGKNTNVLTQTHGSWVFLGQVVTDLELKPDLPLKKTCGSCVRCIDACPTGAIVAPYTIDNTRCISYLTIENRGQIPLEMRPQMGNWVFGCDICQEVCPVNRESGSASVSSPQKSHVHPGLDPEDRESKTSYRQAPATLDLVELLGMSEVQFQHRFQGTSILRAKRVGLQRNACVAMGNLGAPEAVPALCHALIHGETLVRGHAAWALGRIGTPLAKSTLKQASQDETDVWVLQEIADAYSGVD